MRIACLHTADSNRAIFDAARAEIGMDDLVLVHAVRPDLLADAEAAGGLTPAIVEATTQALHDLANDVDAVLLTCSTLGPVVRTAASSITTPVLRVDEAMAREAVRGGGSVLALCTVETTLGPTRTVFEEAASGTGATVEVALVSDAWAAFKAGDIERYVQMIADAADGAAADVVALAQASMAPATKLAKRCVPLASPVSGLRAAVDAVRAG